MNAFQKVSTEEDPRCSSAYTGEEPLLPSPTCHCNAISLSCSFFFTRQTTKLPPAFPLSTHVISLIGHACGHHGDRSGLISQPPAVNGYAAFPKGRGMTWMTMSSPKGPDLTLHDACQNISLHSI